MGYSGQQQRFTVERLGGQDGDRLPTSTCFNTLKLGTPYASAVVLESKLRQALMGAEGFDEAAVAVHCTVCCYQAPCSSTSSDWQPQTKLVPFPGTVQDPEDF